MPATAVSANVNTTDIFVSNSTHFAFGVDGSGNANSHIVFNGTNLVIDSDSDSGSGGAIILDSGGNGVGIGTTSPAEALDVVGNAKVSGNLTASGDLSLTGSNSSESVIAQEWDGTGNNSRIILKNNDVSGTLQEVLRVDAVGNVGIGTSSPARALHVDDVMRLEPRATAPSSPSAGDIFFNSSTNKLQCYDGSVWQDCF